MLFAILSIAVYVVIDTHSAVVSFAMGLLACIVVILLVAGFEEKFGSAMEFFAKYTIPIFLIHMLFVASLRSVGVTYLDIHVMGLVISFMGPIVAAQIMKKTK